MEPRWLGLLDVKEARQRCIHINLILWHLFRKCVCAKYSIYVSLFLDSNNISFCHSLFASLFQLQSVVFIKAHSKLVLFCHYIPVSVSCMNIISRCSPTVSILILASLISRTCQLTFSLILPFLIVSKSHFIVLTS